MKNLAQQLVLADVDENDSQSSSAAILSALSLFRIGDALERIADALEERGA